MFIVKKLEDKNKRTNTKHSKASHNSITWEQSAQYFLDVLDVLFIYMKYKDVKL